ncbi:MAG: 50S ribosomal protein L5, partial [Chloroflexi bacterium]|nr:50S ribosomal protein L5 [Chloroflexota bacterium]
MPRLRERYAKEIVPALMKEFSFKNIMEVPSVRKVIINIGMGEALENPKALENAARDLGAIAGQHPVITRAKKSIANFKVRQGSGIGVMVTLRGSRMYEFLDRLINVTIPRMRDFRGMPNRGFDGRGNYTIGL